MCLCPKRRVLNCATDKTVWPRLCIKCVRVTTVYTVLTPTSNTHRHTHRHTDTHRHTHLEPVTRALGNFIGGILLQSLHHEALTGIYTHTQTETHTHTHTLINTKHDVTRAERKWTDYLSDPRKGLCLLLLHTKRGRTQPCDSHTHNTHWDTHFCVLSHIQSWRHKARKLNYTTHRLHLCGKHTHTGAQTQIPTNILGLTKRQQHEYTTNTHTHTQPSHNLHRKAQMKWNFSNTPTHKNLQVAQGQQARKQEHS